LPQQPEQLHLQLASQLPPDILLNAVPFNLPFPFSLLASVHSRVPAKIELQLHGTSPNLETTSGNGSILLKQATVGGVPVENATASINTESGKITITADDAGGSWWEGPIPR